MSSLAGILKNLASIPDPRFKRNTPTLSCFADALFRAIQRESLKDGFRLEIPEFGVFMISSRKARRIRNPITKDLMMVPTEKTIHFRPVRAWKKLLNGAK